jgi:Domain of unknown function (DUF4440)
MKLFVVIAFTFWLGAGLAAAQSSSSDEGAHVLALDNSWNRALETKDTKALDMLLADTFVSVDVDGSIETKREFLASLKLPTISLPRRLSRNRAKWMFMAIRRWWWECFAPRARTKAKR